MCGAKYPATAGRRGDVAVARGHVQRCRSIFVEEWRARDAKAGSSPAKDVDGLQAMLAALQRADTPAPRAAAEGTRVGAGAASGEPPNGEGGGDPAMEAAPDPDVERADALCGPQEDGTPDTDGEEYLPRVDITQHLQQLECVDVIQELIHRVPTLRRVPWKLRPLVRQAFVSALVLARPGGGSQGGMTNGEKLARLVARMILALPPRPDSPDEN